MKEIIDGKTYYRCHIDGVLIRDEDGIAIDESGLEHECEGEDVEDDVEDTD